MRRARPDELNEDAVPVLVLQLSETRVRELFPIRLRDVEPFAEAEPSEGSLAQLNSGTYFIVMYGKVTQRATLSLPVSANVESAVAEILDEIAIRPVEILWSVDEVTGVIARMNRSASVAAG